MCWHRAFTRLGHDLTVNRLHRLIYFTVIAGVVHYWWLVKADIQRPLAYGVVAALLLGFRIYWTRTHTRVVRGAQTVPKPALR